MGSPVQSLDAYTRKLRLLRFSKRMSCGKPLAQHESRLLSSRVPSMITTSRSSPPRLSRWGGPRQWEPRPTLQRRRERLRQSTFQFSPADATSDRPRPSHRLTRRSDPRLSEARSPQRHPQWRMCSVFPGRGKFSPWSLSPGAARPFRGVVGRRFGDSFRGQVAASWPVRTARYAATVHSETAENLSCIEIPPLSRIALRLPVVGSWSRPGCLVSGGTMPVLSSSKSNISAFL